MYILLVSVIDNADFPDFPHYVRMIPDVRYAAVSKAAQFVADRFEEHLSMLSHSDPNTADEVVRASQHVEAAFSAQGSFSMRLPFGCVMSFLEDNA